MNPHAQALGRLGGLAGRGKPKARTSEQARAAAGVRWRRPVAAIPVPIAVVPLLKLRDILFYHQLYENIFR